MAVPGIALSETYAWTDSDTLASVFTAATNMPAANLKTSNLMIRWQDTSGATGGGVTWNHNGTSISAWAVCLLAMNSNSIEALGATNYTARLSSDATWTGLNLVAEYLNVRLLDDSIYSLVSTGSRERVDGKVFFGIDTLDTGGPSVTGVPAVQAFKSGSVSWVQTNALADGYHRAGALVLGVTPMLFPPASRFDPRLVELRNGYGWEVTIVWDFLPEIAYVSGGTTYRGDRELMNLLAANTNRPLMACLDTQGCTNAGVPNNTEAAPWARLGACRVVRVDEAAPTVGPVSSRKLNLARSVTLRTWQEEAL